MHTPTQSITAPLWLCLLLSACSPDQAAVSEAAPMPPPAEVEVITLAPQRVALAPQYPGRTSGSREIEVRARVEGILLRRNYQEGSTVEAGTVLFEIDPLPYQTGLAQAEARLQQAEAQRRATQRDWDRASAVFAKGAISETERDRVQSTFELAEAGVALAKAEADAARINLDYTTVRAPISGITTREAVSEGSLVGPTQEQSLLTRISSIDPLYVSFAIPETELAGLRQWRQSASAEQALAAELVLEDGTVSAQQGMVNFTDSSVDGTTGTIQARAVFPNPEGNILPGQFVRVRLSGLSLNDALLVPQSAVLQGPQGTFVYSVDQNNLVQYTPIRTGLAVDSQWLVTEGLQAGARVVSNGLLKVQPGQPVSVAGQNAPAPE